MMGAVAWGPAGGAGMILRFVRARLSVDREAVSLAPEAGGRVQNEARLLRRAWQLLLWRSSARCAVLCVSHANFLAKREYHSNGTSLGATAQVRGRGPLSWRARSADGPRQKMLQPPPKPDLPVHLLWDDISPVPTVSVSSQEKKKKKKDKDKEKKKKPNKPGWGRAFVVEEGASAEAKGVTSISMQNLPGYKPAESSTATTPTRAAASDDDDDDDDGEVVVDMQRGEQPQQQQQ